MDQSEKLNLVMNALHKISENEDEIATKDLEEDQAVQVYLLPILREVNDIVKLLLEGKLNYAMYRLGRISQYLDSFCDDEMDDSQEK